MSRPTSVCAWVVIGAIIYQVEASILDGDELRIVRDTEYGQIKAGEKFPSPQWGVTLDHARHVAEDEVKKNIRKCETVARDAKERLAKGLATPEEVRLADRSVSDLRAFLCQIVDNPVVLRLKDY